MKTNKNRKKFSGELQWKIMVNSKQVAQPFISIVGFALLYWRHLYTIRILL